MEQCNPEWPSVPRVAWNLYRHLAREAEVTLVTHERNREAIHNQPSHGEVHFIEESSWLKAYYRRMDGLSRIGGMNWPLRHAISYPVFADFDKRSYLAFKQPVEQGNYDAVMATTPILPRYPYSLVKACAHTPFILGPVNGGIPFPKGFPEIAKKEFAHFNHLRALGKLIPGYRNTYQQADLIFSGSTWTRNWIQKTFRVPDQRLALLWENGVDAPFFRLQAPTLSTRSSVRLLFAGRLVPYKGADMLIEAISRLIPLHRHQIQLDIVGDGPERQNLKKQISKLNLENTIHFRGMVAPEKMPEVFQQADIFCFPSVREFGGAVVMEAMAGGLPCIVADHGGIGEYVTEKTGIKISPDNREKLVTGLTDAIECLVSRPDFRIQLARESWMRAQSFTWSAKSRQILQRIETVINLTRNGSAKTAA